MREDYQGVHESESNITEHPVLAFFNKSSAKATSIHDSRVIAEAKALRENG